MPLHIRAARPHVVLITIDNQPKRNAMPRSMMSELGEAWDRLDKDPDCRCVILTGAGDKGFCAGADIGGDLSVHEDVARIVNRALLKTSHISKPIIAAVNGDCAGGGLELLLATDIRAAVPHARFGLPEVRWSIYPFGGATVKLVNQIGYVHAMDLLLTARLVEAQAAERIGLVNRIIAPDELMPWAFETAATIAENSPSAVQAVKLQISSTIAEHTRSREALEQELGDKVRESPHFAEGVAAFRDKRRPKYE